MPDRIFISYRRDDVPGDARELRNGLTAKFGRANVFMDIEDLLPGEIFDEKLEATLGTCDVLIAVIGPRWPELLKARAAGAEPDYVRQEIAWALARGIIVIPVLVGRTGHMPQMPSRENLPEDIRDLVRRQEHDVAHERFGRDVADLIRAIVTLRRAARPPRSTGPWAVATAGLIGAVSLLLYFGWASNRDTTVVSRAPNVVVTPPGREPDKKPKTAPVAAPKVDPLASATPPQEKPPADPKKAGPIAGAQGAPAECGAATGRGSVALTVYPDVPLYTAQYGEERVSGPPLPFRTRVTILPGARRGLRVLVKVTDGTPCGYVQSSKILSGQPLKVIDLDADEQVRVSIFGVVRNNWTIKAMLRGNPGTTAREALLFDAPDGRPFRSSRGISLFNVFKMEKKGVDPDGWWYFVGGKKVADDKVLSGWARGSELVLWSSGVAVYPVADKRTPFDVYVNVETLMKSAKEGLITTRMSLEPPAGRDVFKLPVLDWIFKHANRDRKAGIPPIGYEIGLLNTAGLVTKGYVKYDAERKNIAFFAAMEPARFSLFQGSLAELCWAMHTDYDLRNRTLGLMLTLAHNLGGDPYNPTETISEYFDRIVFIPKRHFASWLDKSAAEFGKEWGDASAEHKSKLKFSACRSAVLLQQMGAGQKVDSVEGLSLDDLEFDARSVGLKPISARRTYNWLWSTDSKIEFYFVPTEYLPKD